MSFFDQMAPQIAQQAYNPWVMAPRLPNPMPKSNSDFGGVAVSPTSNPGPANMLNAITNMQNVTGENQLRQLQGQQAQAQIALLKAGINAANQPAPPLYLDSQQPNSASSSTAPAPGAAGTATGTGSALTGALGPNQQIIAKTLAGLGHSPVQIAAALGWGSQESGSTDTNTSATNNTGKDGQYGGSYGWQQWLGDRRNDLRAFAKDENGNPADPAVQARFFDYEMRTPGSGASETAQEYYWSATTPGAATLAMAHYGRGQGYTAAHPENTIGFQNRLAAADAYYNTLTANRAPVQLAQNNQPGVASDAGPTSAAPQASGVPESAPASAFAGAGPSGYTARPFGTGAAAPPNAPPPSPSAPASGPIPAPPGAWSPQGPAINPQAIAWAQQQDRVNAILGRRNPAIVDQVLSFAPGGANDVNNIFRRQLAEATAKNQTDLTYAGPIATAQARAKLPFTAARPNSSFPQVDANGNITGWTQAPAAPQAITQYDPATGMGYPSSFTPTSPFGKPFPSTTQPAPGSPGSMPSVLGPGVTANLQTRADAEQKQRQVVIDSANAAQQSQATLQSMSNEVGNFTQGPFSAHAQEAASYLRLIDPSFNGQVASYEDFVKNAGALTRQAVRQVSSRAAVQEFNLIQSTLPNPDMSPIGLRRVTNELQGLNDFAIAKGQAMQAWEQNHGGPGNVTGFETEFQNRVTPYAFIVARMDPTDRKQMFEQLQTSDAGRQQLAKIGQQLQFIKAASLDQTGP